MTNGRPARIRGRLRTICASMFVAALMVASIGAAKAQDDASDELEISIVVRPASVTPVVPVTPTVPDAPGVTPTPAPGISGTVSAQLVLFPINDVSSGDGDALVTIVIRDERGTAHGWDIAITSLPIGAAAWAPYLLANNQLTIDRVLPEDGRLSDQVQGISSGNTLGPFANSISLIHAVQGSGSGLFMQELLFVFPSEDATTLLGTTFMQISFAP